MGASNSTPQNVEFVNKTPIGEVTISEDVLARLQQAKSQHELAKTTAGGAEARTASPPLPKEATSETVAPPAKAVASPGKAVSPQHTPRESAPPKTPVSMPKMSLAVPSYEPVQRQNYGALKEPPTKLQPSDVEEMHYQKTVQHLESQRGKPVYWAQEYQPELESIRTQIKNCYKTYPMEPLRCSELAKEYQQFVFDKQQETARKIGQAKAASNDEDK